MTKTNRPTLSHYNAGSIISSCAAVAVSLCFSGGLWMIMR